MARESSRLARMRATARGFSKRHIALGIAGRPRLRAEGVRASLSVNPAGTNNGILYQAWYRGAAGNSLRIAHVVAGVSTPLSVAVSGNDVTVNVATNGSSAAISTAAQVVAAVAASPLTQNKIFAVSNEGDGSGVVAAQGLTNLTGGQ